MGWETRNGRCYYYQKQRQGRRVRSVYVGANPVSVDALLHLNQVENAGKLAERQRERQHRNDALAIADQVGAVSHLADILTLAAVMTAGYYRHQRGEWRKRKEQPV